MESSRSTGTGESGWVVFAGVVMFIIGSLDALWGLAGILNDDILVVGGRGDRRRPHDLGLVHLILGSVVALTGLGLLVGNEAARWLGVLFLTVNAILQIVWFPAAPLWAFLIIILDVVIIYQLTARWGQQARWDCAEPSSTSTTPTRHRRAICSLPPTGRGRTSPSSPPGNLTVSDPVAASTTCPSGRRSDPRSRRPD